MQDSGNTEDSYAVDGQEMELQLDQVTLSVGEECLNGMLFV